jgi:hypothetical protein
MLSARVEAHCFHIEQHFTGTGHAPRQIFDVKNFGTTKLLDTDGSRHKALLSQEMRTA